MTIMNKTTLPSSIVNNYLLIAKVIMGVAALFAGSQIVIPIQPVPISMQTVVICIIAVTYSPRLSFATVLAYITIGVVGLPIFAELSSGLNVLFGTTGGYLIGFLIATPVIDILNSKFSKEFNNKFLGVFFSCLIGHIIIFSLGVSWLATIIGFKQAIYSGFIILIPSCLVKILIFSSLYYYIKGRKNVL